MEKVVLAYSGGLDTSVIIKYLNEKYNAEVITLTVDVGQQEDFKAIEEKAKSLGVLKHYTIDGKEEFLENYVFPAIKANALYQGKYPIHSALSRPLISRKLVEVAKKEKATAVAHGCTGKGNDQVRFEVTIKSLAPDLKIIAPIRDWKLTRDQEMEYARKHKIPVVAKRSVYSIDENLWGRAIECGELDYPEKEPPKDAFEWTVPPEEAPDKPEYVALEFEEGVPVAINGKKEDKITLISLLNKIAGKNGVGRVDHIEDRLVGIKSREVYEAPAALSIIEAHKDLEKLVLTRHELAFKEPVDAQWTWLAYSGLWLDPLKEDLEAFINNTQNRVSGEVKLKMYKGHVMVVGRSSPYSLYDLNLATYNIKTTFDQTAAQGFIELWGLPTKVASVLKAKKKELANKI
jgi:argininosuccinate synthase